MKILFASGREPSYARNSIILKGLKQNNVDLILCTSNSKNPIIRYIHVTAKLLKNRKKDYDAVFVGFFGQPLMPIINLLVKKPIVFDAFLSGYETLVFDKKKIKKNSIKAKIFHYLDKKSCKLADKVLLDTNQHINYFVKEFKIRKDKFSRILIGADGEIFYPKAKQKNKKFIIEFHGGFIPLQGVEYIVNAAKLLEKHKDIEFVIIGDGQTYNKCITLAKKLGIKNTIFLGMKNPKEIPDYLANCDIGLGIFGNTNKTKRVIPNKAYEILAMRRPLITSDTAAARELFKNKENVLFCKTADSSSIAKAILELKRNKKLRDKIAVKGYEVFKKNCSTLVLGKQIKGIIRDIN